MALSGKLGVLVVGAGAIGLSVAGWIFPKNKNLHLLARGESLSALRKNGLHLYQLGQEATTAPIPLKVVESIDEAPTPDVVIITVKNYDLEQVAQILRKQIGDKEPIVASLQNGVENQRILPKYFSRTVYGVVCYNAWRDGLGRVGYVKRGYMIVGTPNNELRPEVEAVSEVFKSGLECSITDRFQDAVYCKLAINLINGLMALVGFRNQDAD